MKYNIINSNIARLAAIALVAGATTACGDEDIDNSYSRSNSVIQIETSSEYVILDEAHPDDVALTVTWNEAHPYGNEFITTYQYELDAIGSKASARKEYEDDGVYRREYTNSELQELLTGHFGCLTSSQTTLSITVTASFEGPRVVIPDIATASVCVKTYGPKQFKADRVFIGGEAAGEEIELTPTSATSGIYMWTGALSAGKINFPVFYGDEHNAISPAEANAPIQNDEMPAIMADADKANYWLIPEADNYRVTINFNNQTVKIVSAGDIIEVDHLLMAGSATGDTEIEIERTLEDDGVYAWRGELKAGKLYMPLLFNEDTAVSFVPKDKNDRDIHDGEAREFQSVPTATGTATAYWEIPADGTYRIVVNTTEHTVTFYSAATDMPNMTVSYNNTVDGINPYTQEVTELWMWGGFNASAHDDGLKAGFQSKYTLKQSLANPYVFVYKGDKLPRSSSTDSWTQNTLVAAMNFLVSNIENNVYAFGSTADAKRNSKRATVDVSLGQELQLVAGQGDNRYAYFSIPENCNFVVVDIKNLTVTFDNK
ncbi:MAG: DUF5116 domain-containing protein [Bacteroidales bacterium]|nr:DUF5116 domain-containing protein [Bacteroidales bacterium]